MMPRRIPTLTSLRLRNFRAFEKASIKFAPITILVGPNNAGKSSIVSALRVLSQTLASVDPDTSLLLEELGSYKDAVYLNESKRSIGFGLTLEYDAKEMSIDLSYGYRSQRREVILRQFMASELRNDGTEEIMMRTTLAPETGSQLLREFRGIPDVNLAKLPVTFMHFLPRFGTIWLDRLGKKMARVLKSELPNFQPITLFKQYQDTNRAFIRMHRFLVSLQYLGPFRETPTRLYPFSGERPSVLERTGKGATDVLMSDYFRRGGKKRQLTSRVKAWLGRAQIADDIQVTALSDRHYQVTLKHPITGESSNIADVGFGASQVLPVLVAGYDILEESLLLIEQPEIHLHPSAQAELGEFFLDVYRRDVQCVIETHSEHLIMRLQTKVALGEIPKEDIIVNYINPTKDGKQIVQLMMNDDGVFTEKWPNGFFDERMAEALDLARAPLVRKKAKS
jgi:predicted ATPase